MKCNKFLKKGDVPMYLDVFDAFARNGFPLNFSSPEIAFKNAISIFDFLGIDHSNQTLSDYKEMNTLFCDVDKDAYGKITQYLQKLVKKNPFVLMQMVGYSSSYEEKLSDRERKNTDMGKYVSVDYDQFKKAIHKNDQGEMFVDVLFIIEKCFHLNKVPSDGIQKYLKSHNIETHIIDNSYVGVKIAYEFFNCLKNDISKYGLDKIALFSSIQGHIATNLLPLLNVKITNYVSVRTLFNEVGLSLDYESDYEKALLDLNKLFNISSSARNDIASFKDLFCVYEKPSYNNLVKFINKVQRQNPLLKMGCYNMKLVDNVSYEFYTAKQANNDKLIRLTRLNPKDFIDNHKDYGYVVNFQKFFLYLGCIFGSSAQFFDYLRSKRISNQGENYSLEIVPLEVAKQVLPVIIADFYDIEGYDVLPKLRLINYNLTLLNDHIKTMKDKPKASTPEYREMLDVSALFTDANLAKSLVNISSRETFSKGMVNFTLKISGAKLENCHQVNDKVFLIDKDYGVKLVRECQKWLVDSPFAKLGASNYDNVILNVKDYIVQMKMNESETKDLSEANAYSQAEQIKNSKACVNVTKKYFDWYDFCNYIKARFADSSKFLSVAKKITGKSLRSERDIDLKDAKDILLWLSSELKKTIPFRNRIPWCMEQVQFIEHCINAINSALGIKESSDEFNKLDLPVNLRELIESIIDSKIQKLLSEKRYL